MLAFEMLFQSNTCPTSPRLTGFTMDKIINLLGAKTAFYDAAGFAIPHYLVLVGSAVAQGGCLADILVLELQAFAANQVLAIGASVEQRE